MSPFTLTRAKAATTRLWQRLHPGGISTKPVALSDTLFTELATLEKRYRPFPHAIGRAKYVVTYHNGARKHDDGSDFYDVAIFHRKADAVRFMATLRRGGYAEE